MTEWMSWPWIEMLLACTFLMGTLMMVFQLTRSYPANRFLGQLLASYMMIIIVYQFGELQAFRWFTVGLTSLSFFWYSRSFFTQNSRVSWMHILPFLTLICLGYWDNITILRIFGSLVTLFYLVQIVSSTNKESKARGINLFSNPGGRLIWYRNFYLINLIFLIGLLTSFEYAMPIWITAATLVLVIMIYVQVFMESDFSKPIPIGNKYKKSTLSAAQKSAILENLDHVLLGKKFFLRDDASLANLATELHTTTHHLSQVLNESKGVSFQELISQHRVREARSLLKSDDQKHTKVEQIAAMVGYNSKSAFNTAFKKYTGVTPSEYRESKDVRSYREERLPDRKAPSNQDSTFSLGQLFTIKLKQNMVLNFFKIFYRNLRRNKVFSLMNLFGLTVGFACSMLIYLYIQSELSYDKDLADSERIYRINWLNENPQTRTPHPMAQAMARDWPEVEAAVSISPWYGSGLSKQKVKVKNEETNIVFEEPDFYFADSTFFNVFDLAILAGDARTLYQVNKLVITETMAAKYFDEDNPIGKLLHISDMPMEIGVVVKDMPKKSHFHFNALISYPTIKQINPENPWFKWADFGHFNYIKTNPNVDINLLEARIPDWFLGYVDWGIDYQNVLREGLVKFELMPISDIHLHSHLRWELESNGHIFYIYILAGTLFFILIIVAINYINLTTAKSVDRAKEIGVRKTLGAVSGNLTIQFYLESVVFCLAALILSYLGSIMLLEGFNQLSDNQFEVEQLLSTQFLLKTILVTLVIGILSGLYPAITLSSFRPSEVLKGKFSSSDQGSRLRNMLVTMQFFVSAILITGSLIILKQIDFMKTRDLGFKKEAVVSLRIPQSVEHGGTNMPMLRKVQNQLKAIPGVLEVSAVSNLPGGQFNQHSIYAKKDPSNRIDASEMQIDFKAIELLGLEMAQGRLFDPKYATDSSGSNYILNETAVRLLQLSDPIGEKIVWLDNENTLEGQVVGVVKDFHYKSLHVEIHPLIMQVNPWDFDYVLVKLEGNKYQDVLEQIETIYAQFDSDLPFEYHFLDQQIADLYDREERTLNVFSAFAIVAVFLACLGLLGIALAFLHQKVKEVGIRKILGASSNQIFGMVVMQFAKLIGIALLFGLPSAYLLMQNWLKEFPYQASIGIMPFVMAAIALMVIALTSVALVIVKIASSNPVNSLRYE